jgi:acyl carrier protein
VSGNGARPPARPYETGPYGVLGMLGAIIAGPGAGPAGAVPGPAAGCGGGRDVLGMLRPAVADIAGVPDSAVTAAARFDALGCDSLSVVEIAVAAESATGVAVPDSALGGLATVGDLAAYVERGLAGGGHG